MRVVYGAETSTEGIDNQERPLAHVTLCVAGIKSETPSDCINGSPLL